MTQYSNYSQRYNPQQQELRSPVLDGLTTAGVTTGVGVTLHAGGKALLKKGESGVVTAFKSNMLEQGFKTDAVDLFGNKGTGNAIKRVGEFGEDTMQLGGRFLGQTGEFGKAALRTPSGKVIVGLGTGLGVLTAWNASKHNEQLVDKLKSQNETLGMLRLSDMQERLSSSNLGTDVF